MPTVYDPQPTIALQAAPCQPNAVQSLANGFFESVGGIIAKILFRR
jgi:hypothetical protein